MSDTKQKTPAQLRRKVEMLEAQVAELRAKLATAYSGWGDLCMEKIVAQERCKQALRILSGEDE